MSEQFTWVVVSTDAHGKLTEAAVCDEGAVAEVQAEMKERRLLVQKFPATVDKSVTFVTPEMLKSAVQIRDWVHGPPGSTGPGKVPGKQQRIGIEILKLLRLMTGGRR